jgi:uncharacterized protein with ParB-like and HNH nuclease domain
MNESPSNAILPTYKTIQQVLQSQSFAIDEYQREYKWDKDNINELINDFQNQFLGSHETDDETDKVATYQAYFLGSIIVCKKGEKNFLIDGQQRITSLTLLLIFLYRTSVKMNLAVAQTLAPLIFSDQFGKPKFNLDIPERLPVIEALFKGITFHSEGKDESTQAMYARYKDIESHEFFEELGGRIAHFSYWLLSKVGLIEISTTSDKAAYLIFETMNDRGKPLNPIDMLKAYLITPIQDHELRAEINAIWKKQVLGLMTTASGHEPERAANGIKAWLRAQYAASTRDRKAGAVDKDWELIGTLFHRWVRENSKRLNLGKGSQNADFIRHHFSFFTEAYQTILNASSVYTKGLEAVFYNAHNDFTWQSTVLLAPLIESDDPETMRKKIAVTATYLDIWLIRRVTNYIRVGYSSVSYAMWALCCDIRRKTLTELVDILSRRLNEDTVSFKGVFTNGKQERYGISEFFLNQFSRRYIFHILARITAFTEVGAGRTDSFPALIDRTVKNPFDIEHIWANNFEPYQDLFKSENDFWSDREHIGAILLLPADVNRSLQDKLFAEKVPHYSKQNFYAASFSSTAYQHQPQFEKFTIKFKLPFRAYSQFGQNELTERIQLVEMLVETIWSSHRLIEVAS